MWKNTTKTLWWLSTTVWELLLRPVCKQEKSKKFILLLQSVCFRLSGESEETTSSRRLSWGTKATSHGQGNLKNHFRTRFLANHILRFRSEIQTLIKNPTISFLWWTLEVNTLKAWMGVFQGCFCAFLSVADVIKHCLKSRYRSSCFYVYVTQRHCHSTSLTKSHIWIGWSLQCRREE